MDWQKNNNSNECSSGNVKVELDLSNYATKDDLKGVLLLFLHVVESNLAAKSDFASLAQVNK